MCDTADKDAISIIRSKRTGKWQVQYKSDNKVNIKHRGASYSEDKREGFLEKLVSELNFEKCLLFLYIVSYFQSLLYSFMVSFLCYENQCPSLITHQKSQVSYIYEELQKSNLCLSFNSMSLLPHQTALRPYHWVNSDLLSMIVYWALFQPKPKALKSHSFSLSGIYITSS